MEVLYFLFALVLVGVGVFAALKPEEIYYFQEAFRSSTPGEPSRYYLISTRIGGAVMAAVGAACAVILLVPGI